MLPVIASRVYYVDGLSKGEESTLGATPPTRRTGVQIIVYYHGGKYRTFSYGTDTYRWLPDPSVELISGREMRDDEWETLRARAYAAPEPE